MKLRWPMLLLLMASACGRIQVFQTSALPLPGRTPDSVGLSTEQIDQRIEQHLTSLYHYQIIAQQQLQIFDQSLESISLTDLYESSAYLKLRALRSQMEQVEHDLEKTYDSMDEDNPAASRLRQRIAERLKKFSQTSVLKSVAAENLIYRLKLRIEKPWKRSPLKKEIQREYEAVASTPLFQVHEKNIEHLSYMLETRQEIALRQFQPSVTKSGNITGNEFPAKVWSLTFDDGPRAETTAQILDNLKHHGLPATFFQLTSAAKINPTINQALRSAGMEIASHSYTHQQLTKVSATILEKEITQASQELGKIHQRPIRFFRLPYGAGVNTPDIRQRIADAKLIHVFWNIDTLDWMAQPPEKIVARTLELMKKTPRDAGVILFHDIHQRTVIASAEIMKYLKQENRRVCTLGVIVDEMNQSLPQVCSSK